MDVIDLRSDTVTRPSPAMRAAIAPAEVGDDQFGEDPTTNRLQERAAELLGKEAALWLPTGTMANQVALRLLTRPGDDVIVSRESHAVWHETGAGAANAGVQFTEVGTGGTFTAADFVAAYKPRGHLIYPPTTLVEVEDTHNRAGGVVFPPRDAAEICATARERGVATYLDGARLFNSAVAGGRPLAELAAPFDLVAISLSKGLGAPGGSLLAGPREHIAAAVRYRRMAGGAMRQVGIFAAAGLYALDHNVDRLAEDHANARRFAELLLDVQRCSAPLAQLRAGIPAESAGGADERSNGNGSLMRTLPLALVGRDLDDATLADHAHRASAVTHANPLSQATCAAYVLIAVRLLRGETKREALPAQVCGDLRAHYDATAQSDHLAALETLAAWPTRGGRGYVVDSFWSAWDSFAGAGDYREAVTAAILYGVYFGLESIPTEWLSATRGREIVEPLIHRLAAAVSDGVTDTPRNR